MPYDRQEVLARTDLAGLADELLGPRRGRGRSATWACPDPAHGPQSGRTPPVSMFASPSGTERWRCHACSAGGTAADLVMATQGVGFAEAIDLLARRAGLGQPAEALAAARPRPPSPQDRIEPRMRSAAIEAHVAACEAYLWSPEGAPVRRYLARRGLGEEVLRANRVGADPGPRALPRAPGLPRAGAAAVLPLLDDEGRAVYLQARYLQPPGGRKYGNPTTALAGPSPRMAEVRLPGPAAEPLAVLVCEGIPDALIAAQAGYRAVAVLGAGLADERLAADLARRHPSERLALAFDADARGRAGATRLARLLESAGAGRRVGVLEVPPAWGDLTGWHLADAEGLRRQLATAVGPAGVAVAITPPRLPQPLADRLETIHYRHLLVDAPALASHNLSQIRRAVDRWQRTGPAPQPPAGPSSLLGRDLDTLAYRLLADDRSGTARHVEAISDTVAAWSHAPEAAGSGVERPRSVVTGAPPPDLAEPPGLGIEL